MPRDHITAAKQELLTTYLLRSMGNLFSAFESEEFRNKTDKEKDEYLRGCAQDPVLEQRLKELDRLEEENRNGLVDEDIEQKDLRKYELAQAAQNLFSPIEPDPSDPPAPGSFDALGPEIWARVLSFLVPPTPKPLSGVTKREYAYLANHPDAGLKGMYKDMPEEGEAGTTSRRDIRARELAVLMRTSIAFNFQAARHLYRDVITDNLPGLTYNIDYPSGHSQIESKNQLLRRIRTLRLEYGQKEDDTNYVELMESSLRFSFLGELNPAVDTIQQGTNEAVRISHCLVDMQGGKVRFPALTHLAMCSVFGGHESLWDGVTYPESGFVFHGGDGTQPSIADLVTMCRQSIMLIFRASPLVHYCQRSYTGPLSLPAVFDWDDVFPASRGKKHPSSRHLGKLPRADFLPAATIPLFTMHLRTASVNNVGASPIHPTRWLLELPDRKQYTTNALVDNYIYTLEEYTEEVRKAGFDNFTFNIEAFISSYRYTPIRAKSKSSAKTVLRCDRSDEGAKLDMIHKHVVKGHREGGLPDVDGITSWRASTESPRCEACGWEFEEA